METLVSIVLVIVGLAVTFSIFMIASAVSGIASTLREMQAEQQKIYKALYLIAQAQGIGTRESNG